MSALDEFASDVDGIIADLNAQAAVLNDRKTKLKERGNDVLARWAQHFSDQEASLTRAESALNRISNVPLSESSPPKTATEKLSEIPLKVANG